MKFDYLKNRQEYTTAALLVISAVLVIAIAVKLLAFGVSSITVPRLIRKAVAVAQSQIDAKSIEEYLSTNKKKADELKNNNRFAPPPLKPGPPSVVGILGDKALINGKWFGVGETAAEAKIVAIGAAEVTIEWQGKEMKLAPIKTAGSSSSPSASAQSHANRNDQIKRPEKGGPEKTRLQRPARRQGRRFGRMSPEERRKMREKMANMSAEEIKEYIRELQEKQ